MRKIVILIIGSLFVAASLSADESSNRPRIQFVSCPDTLVVDPTGSTSVHFELTPSKGRKPQNAPRYFIVSGPGEIDSVTGVWSFTANSNMSFHDTAVVVGGMYTHNPHRDTAFCAFTLKWECTIGPSIIGECPRYAGSFVSDRNAYVQLHARGCGMLYWGVLDDANPATFVSIDSSGLLRFMSTEAGEYEVTVILSDGMRFQLCVVQFAIREQSSYGIRIEESHNTLQGQNVNIDITMVAIDTVHSLGGFNMLVAYDQAALSLQNVSPGTMIDFCNWEYFTYRFGADGNCDSGCPSGLVRVIGIAETNNGSAHPIEDCPADGMTLFSLTYFVSNDRSFECHFLPVRFFWNDCGDNTIADNTGYLLFMANRVFEHYSDALPIHPSLATFPGYVGVPEGACIDTILSKPDPRCDIDYYGGGVDIVCADPIDSRGDLNLNFFPFEIADEVLFSRYFIYGTSVFTVNMAGQIATFDVNAGGLTLTIEDFVLCYRAIVHEWDTHETVPASNQPLVYSLVGGVLTASTTDTLGAIYLKVPGEVSPYANSSRMKTESRFDGSVTHILVRPDFESPAIDAYLLAGDLIEGLGVGPILEFKAATYRGGKITSTYDAMTSVDETEHLIPESFTLRQNYPNPFNAGTVISFDLPRASEVKLEIINILGNVVYRQIGDYGAGTHRIFWKGTTNAGAPVASGIYYYRITAGAFVATRKMLILK